MFCLRFCFVLDKTSVVKHELAVVLSGTWLLKFHSPPDQTGYVHGYYTVRTFPAASSQALNQTKGGGGWGGGGGGKLSVLSSSDDHILSQCCRVGDDHTL